MVASCQYGFGRHFDAIEPGDKHEAMKVSTSVLETQVSYH